MNTYDIYRNGELIEQNAPYTKLHMITGITPANLVKYLGLEKGYPSKDGNLYTYHYGVIISHPGREKGKTEKAEITQMPQEWQDDWNNVFTAAKKIREGTHHIVSGYVHGKWTKYTEAKK
jgi:hypothetical protein